MLASPDSAVTQLENFDSYGQAIDFFSKSQEWQEGEKFSGPLYTHRLEGGEWIEEVNGKKTNKTETKQKENDPSLHEHLKIINDLQTKKFSIVKKSSSEIMTGTEVAKASYGEKMHVMLYMLKEDGSIEMKDFEGTKKELEELFPNYNFFEELDYDDDDEDLAKPKSEVSIFNTLSGVDNQQQKQESKNGIWDGFWGNLIKATSVEQPQAETATTFLDLFSMEPEAQELVLDDEEEVLKPLSILNNWLPKLEVATEIENLDESLSSEVISLEDLDLETGITLNTFDVNEPTTHLQIKKTGSTFFDTTAPLPEPTPAILNSEISGIKIQQPETKATVLEESNGKIELPTQVASTLESSIPLIASDLAIHNPTTAKEAPALQATEDILKPVSEEVIVEQAVVLDEPNLVNEKAPIIASKLEIEPEVQDSEITIKQKDWLTLAPKERVETKQSEQDITNEQTVKASSATLDREPVSLPSIIEAQRPETTARPTIVVEKTSHRDKEVSQKEVKAAINIDKSEKVSTEQETIPTVSIKTEVEAISPVAVTAEKEESGVAVKEQNDAIVIKTEFEAKTARVNVKSEPKVIFKAPVKELKEEPVSRLVKIDKLDIIESPTIPDKAPVKQDAPPRAVEAKPETIKIEIQKPVEVSKPITIKTAEKIIPAQHQNIQRTREIQNNRQEAFVRTQQEKETVEPTPVPAILDALAKLAPKTAVPRNILQFPGAEFKPRIQNLEIQAKHLGSLAPNRNLKQSRKIKTNTRPTEYKRINPAATVKFHNDDTINLVQTQNTGIKLAA